jgi:hypothetical protein
MNQKMTQACRPEKNEDFFRGSNFGRLNNYKSDELNGRNRQITPFLKLLGQMWVLIIVGVFILETDLFAENQVLKSETVIWNYKLDSREVFKTWPKCAEHVRDGDSIVLKITSSEIRGKTLKAEDAMFVGKSFSRDEMTKIIGKTITCTVMCKGENLRYDSAHFELITGRHGHKTVADKVHAAIGKGSFDWKQLKLIITIASDTCHVEINFGLQRGEPGTVYFKDFTVTVSE